MNKNGLLSSMPWYYGNIDRKEAENVLVPRQVGLYLVRECAHFPGDYTLSVSMSDKEDVQHYRIKKLPPDDQLTIDEEVYFKTLVELIEHYKTKADGLCTRLIRMKPNIKSNILTFKDLTMHELIGKGFYSEVFRGEYKGMEVAIKTVSDQSTAEQFLIEADVMTKLEHPNLVRLIGVVDEGSVYIVTEYMSKGSLIDYLRTRGRTVITKSELLRFVRDSCSGMAYLEAQGVVHRDLAARNVLVHETGTAKISDFGLARSEEIGPADLDNGKTAAKWTAPEAHKQKVFTSKSDMWSFGILLWEVYSFGRVPYPRIPLADVMAHLDKGYRMEPPEGCPPEVYEIMQQAWNMDPSKRPLFKDVLVRLDELCSRLAT